MLKIIWARHVVVECCTLSQLNHWMCQAFKGILAPTWIKVTSERCLLEENSLLASNVSKCVTKRLKCRIRIKISRRLIDYWKQRK